MSKPLTETPIRNRAISKRFGQLSKAGKPVSDICAEIQKDYPYLSEGRIRNIAYNQKGRARKPA